MEIVQEEVKRSSRKIKSKPAGSAANTASLSKDNNGLYTNEWLLADTKTNEIAMFELGTHKTKLYRSSKNEWFGDTPGFYWGCNNTKDREVRLETIASVNDRPITIGKILSGIAYFICGMMLAKLISRLIGRHVLPRFGLNDGATHAIQSITFYSLCVMSSLLSLELVNLPFAAFTFLGGAVAIGIGLSRVGRPE